MVETCGELHRSAVPMLVHTDSVGPRWMIATMAAMKIWNQAIQVRVFQPDLGDPWNLTVEERDPESPKAIGTTHLDWSDDCEIGAGLIIVRATTERGLEVPLLVHELGHVLGLAHDNDLRSVMYEDVNPEGQILPDDIARVKQALR